MTFKRILLLLPLLIAASASVCAQTPPAKDQPYEFRLAAWNFDLPGLFYEQSGKKRPTPVIERSTTQPFTYVGPTGKLVLYTQKIVEGSPVKITIVELTLVPPPRKNLILLWHERTGNYSATVLADDPQTPPPGHLRFVNISGQNLALQCNGMDRFTLSPGTDRVVPPTNGGVGVGVKVARQRKKADPDSWELALMSGIPVEPNERVTAFIADPERLSLSIGQKSLLDQREKELLSLFFIRDTVTK